MAWTRPTVSIGFIHACMLSINLHLQLHLFNHFNHFIRIILSGVAIWILLALGVALPGVLTRDAAWDMIRERTNIRADHLKELHDVFKINPKEVRLSLSIYLVIFVHIKYCHCAYKSI